MGFVVCYWTSSCICLHLQILDQHCWIAGISRYWLHLLCARRWFLPSGKSSSKLWLEFRLLSGDCSYTAFTDSCQLLNCYSWITQLGAYYILPCCCGFQTSSEGCKPSWEQGLHPNTSFLAYGTSINATQPVTVHHSRIWGILRTTGLCTSEY